MAEDKTEKPTPRRLRKARREGQFPRTPDAATWAAMAAAAVMLPRTGHIAQQRFTEIAHRWPDIAADPTPAAAMRILEAVPGAVLTSVLPVSVATVLTAVLVTAAQGVHPSAAALKPKFSRMNPKNGVKRMFGMQAAWEAVKALLKVSAIGLVVYITGRGLLGALFGSGAAPLEATLERAKHGLLTALWSATVVGLLLAVADYAYQRRSVMKRLRMSHKDIRDEMKQTEGDPMLKGAIRSRQMAMSRNRMLSAVAEADVVLVNPTHIAVAVRYERGRGAPRVVAKGAGNVALKIRERAREHGVPVLEDKPLARALYRICEIGEEIPNELYLAVARILAFVMAANRARAGGGGGAPARPGPTTGLPELPTKGELRTRRREEVRKAMSVRRPSRRPPTGGAAGPR